MLIRVEHIPCERLHALKWAAQCNEEMHKTIWGFERQRIVDDILASAKIGSSPARSTQILEPVHRSGTHELLDCFIVSSKWSWARTETMQIL